MRRTLLKTGWKSGAQVNAILPMLRGYLSLEPGQRGLVRYVLYGHFRATPVGEINFELNVTCAPTSLHSRVESAVSARPILTVFFCSVKRCFSVPATILHAAARSLGQAWPKATGEAGAQRA